MRCALCGCKGAGTPLHRFPNPHKFPEQFKAWVNVMGETLENPENQYASYKHKRICDIHFRIQDRNRNNRLNALAVPSLHLPMWCNEPNMASSSSVAPSNVESTIEKVWCNEPIVALSASVAPSNVESTMGKGENTGMNIHNSSTSFPASMNLIDDHSYCLRPRCEQIGVLDEKSSASITSSYVREEHNYFSNTSNLVQQGVLDEKSSASITSSYVREEHNYFSNTSNLVQQGKRSSRCTVSSHLMAKLKLSVQQIKNLKREIVRLRKRGLNFKERLQNAEKLSANMAFKTITKNMSNPAKLFTMIQYREGAKKPKGRRFTQEEKILALSIFKRSSKCYSLLARQFALPSKKTLKLLLSTIKLKPGINNLIFEKIKKTVALMNTDNKLCTLIFDEMSITPQIQYDASRDELRGFTCDGKKIADHVLVFMVKGIKANFKQPVAYYFTNSLSKTELKTILIEVIKSIQATGLQVISTVCDQSTVNVSTINSLVEDTKSQYMRRGREFRFTHFKINNHIIIPLYDVPHLLKGIRNNLLNKDLKYFDRQNNEKKVKWEHFEMVYTADKSYGELRLAHKLTEEHVNKEKIKKMKVKAAAQLFSHSVAVAAEHLSARGDLPPECRDLIPLVLLLDKLFDSLNGNTFHIPNGKIYKGCVKRNSPHHKLWQNAIQMLKTVKFIIKKNCDGRIRFIESTVPSIQNFIKTIEGVQNLWKILHEKYSFDCLLTRNLNQDPVENFFGNIRSYGVRNVAPNCVAFEGAYKSLLLNNYNAPHSIQANCEEDKNDCLQSFDFFLTDKPSSNVPENAVENYVFNENILNATERVIGDKGQHNYVCGWVIAKCLKNVTKSCRLCRHDLNSQEESEENAFIKSKEYNRKKKWLCYPSNAILKMFQEVQSITCTFLKKDVPKNNLKMQIKMMCDTLIVYNFNCAIHKENLKSYFVDTTIKILIYSWCRSINRILSGKITYDSKDNDELKLAAHVYYTKHKHNKNPK